MPVFELPAVLHPVRESTGCIRVPNVAVGKVSIDGQIVPVFSAFFSHVCMLPKEQWSVVHVPKGRAFQPGDAPELSVEAVTENLAALTVTSLENLPVFVDPITAHVFEGCVWNFFEGDKNDIAFLRVHVQEADSRTAWYDVGSAYGAAIEKLKKSATGTEPPAASKTEKTESSAVLLEVIECPPSPASPSSSEIAVEV